MAHTHAAQSIGVSCLDLRVPPVPCHTCPIRPWPARHASPRPDGMGANCGRGQCGLKERAGRFCRSCAVLFLSVTESARMRSPCPWASCLAVAALPPCCAAALLPPREDPSHTQRNLLFPSSSQPAGPPSCRPRSCTRTAYAGHGLYFPIGMCWPEMAYIARFTSKSSFAHVINPSRCRSGQRCYPAGLRCGSSSESGPRCARSCSGSIMRCRSSTRRLLAAIPPSLPTDTLRASQSPQGHDHGRREQS